MNKIIILLILMMSLLICSHSFAQNDQLLDEAIEQTTSRLEALRDSFGLLHEDTLSSLDELIGLYHQKGLWTTTLALADELIAMRKLYNGPEHILTLRAMARCRDLHFELANYNLAQNLALEVKEAGDRLLGEWDPFTIDATFKLILGHYSLGETLEGLRVLDLLRDALTSNTSLAPSFESILRAQYLSALGHFLLGDYEGAGLFVDVILEDPLLQDFPELYIEAWALKRNILYFSADLENYLILKDQLLSPQAVYDPSLPIALKENTIFAAELSALRAPEAGALYRDILALAQDKLGQRHPITLNILLSYRSHLLSIGQEEGLEMISNIAKELPFSEASFPVDLDLLPALELMEEGNYSEALGLLQQILFYKLAILEHNNPHLTFLYTLLAEASFKASQRENSLLIFKARLFSYLQGDYPPERPSLNLEEAVFYAKLACEYTQEREFAQEPNPYFVPTPFVLENRYHLLASLLLYSDDRMPEALFAMDLVRTSELEGFKDQKHNIGLMTDPEREIKDLLDANVRSLRLYNLQRTSHLLQVGDISLISLPMELPQDLTQSSQSFFAALLESLQEAMGRTPKTLPLAAQDDPEVLRFIEALGEDEALIHIFLAEESSFLVISRPAGVYKVMTKVPKERYLEAIEAFRESLGNIGLESLVALEELHSLSIQTLLDKGYLEPDSISKLFFYLDGPMRQIPMAALYDGQRFLVESYTIQLYPPNASKAHMGPVAKEANIIGLATSLPYHGLNPLLGAELETSLIVKDKDNPQGLFPGTKAINKSFTYEFLINALKKPPDLIHIATHFLYNPIDHRNSKLLIGDGDLKSLATMDLDANFNFAGTRLIALSACETDLGPPSEDARELESLASLIVIRGGGCVLSTLWKIDDGATRTIMELFYLNLSDGYTIAQSLARAQVAVIKGHLLEASENPRGDILTSATNPGLTWDAHPYFWGPFVLNGACN
ncbi:MAG: CHAT domain-containing protein [Deltaproteobacteria bacterium]|jgi:CHAT domain-containing protein|nr:CHAT domain-containing protein [Deltaproteobacteria bacterium]